MWPSFSIYDAALEGGNLHYLFSKSGQVYLAAVHLSESGSASNFRRNLLTDTFSTIRDAQFVKGQYGRTILRIQRNWKEPITFQFDPAGEPVSVPEK